MADDKTTPSKAAPQAPQAAPAAGKRYLVTTDCYRHDLGRYLKKGEFVTLPAGHQVKPSQTWTEVDGAGAPVKGGQQARPIARIVDTKKKING